MNAPITIQPPPLSVTIMLTGEPIMIRSDFTDSMGISATKAERAVAVALLHSAIEVLRRGDAS